jgi:hypothetical protein
MSTPAQNRANSMQYMKMIPTSPRTRYNLRWLSTNFDIVPHHHRSQLFVTGNGDPS